MKLMLWMVGAAVALAGCSQAAGSKVEDDAAAQVEQAREGSGESQSSEERRLPDFAPEQDQAAISSLTWSDDGALMLGYADGNWASVDLDNQEGLVEPVLADEVAVEALSPKAKLALVIAEHPVVVRLRDQQAVLRLRDIEQPQAAGFFGDGRGLYVVESRGSLHVWDREEAELDGVSSSDLKQFMARQTPEFSAQLSPLSGPALLTPNNALFLSTEEGKVLRWDPAAPEAVDAVVQLPGPARSMGYGRSHLAVTTAEDELRVVDLHESTFAPWSMNEERGELVAASPKLRGAFASADEANLGLREFEDGSFRWKDELPEGDLCGLSVAPDAAKLVVCVDSALLVVDAESGEFITALRRRDDAIEWYE